MRQKEKKRLQELAELSENLKDILSEGGPYCSWDHMDDSVMYMYVTSLYEAHRKGIINTEIFNGLQALGGPDSECPDPKPVDLLPNKVVIV